MTDQPVTGSIKARCAGGCWAEGPGWASLSGGGARVLLTVAL